MINLAKLIINKIVMINKVLILFSLIFTVSCSNLKTTERQLSSGNYDEAIDISLNYLRKNRNGKKATDHHKLLFESYTKAVDKDKRNIAYYELDNNTENLERIYSTYQKLEYRQTKIRPLLPIHNYHFKTENYSQNIVNYKNKLSEFIYQDANLKLASNNVELIREAHEDFKYIKNLNPNYKDVHALIEESHYRGTDFVLLSFKNNSNKIIPRNLQKNLLNLDQYQLDDYWTEYHNTPQKNTTYHYTMILSFENIYVSPEKIKEVFISQQKEIIDGKEYVLDKNGNVKKDEKGNDITKDKKVIVKSRIHKHTQFKQAVTKAKAIFINRVNGKIVSSIPIKSSFVFEHTYATQRGDKRAIQNNFRQMLTKRHVPFPTDSQMVYDTGEDIKRQLQNILTRQRF